MTTMTQVDQVLRESFHKFLEAFERDGVMVVQPQ